MVTSGSESYECPSLVKLRRDKLECKKPNPKCQQRAVEVALDTYHHGVGDTLEVSEDWWRKGGKKLRWLVKGKIGEKRRRGKPAAAVIRCPYADTVAYAHHFMTSCNPTGSRTGGCPRFSIGRWPR